jgi:hypothetical protein
VSGDHPFGACLSKHGNFVAWLNAEFTHSFAEILSLEFGFDEVAPLVITQSVLLEESSIRLHFIFLTEDLASSEASLCRVNVHNILEHLLESVDFLSEHVDVVIFGWIHVAISDLSIIHGHGLCL